MTLSSVVVSHQKERTTVSKLFYVINLDSGLSVQANDSASIVKCTKERDFQYQNARGSAARGQVGMLQLSKSLRV